MLLHLKNLVEASLILFLPDVIITSTHFFWSCFRHVVAANTLEFIWTLRGYVCVCFVLFFLIQGVWDGLFVSEETLQLGRGFWQTRPKSVDSR